MYFYNMAAAGCYEISSARYFIWRSGNANCWARINPLRSAW